MNIDKYIKWDEIWNEEVCIETAIDGLDEDDDAELIDVIQQFLQDKEVDLLFDECYLSDDGGLIFFFGESGGQNESDTQGWSRDYTFGVDEDFMIISVEYSQG